jgi:hypothetical protein
MNTELAIGAAIGCAICNAVAAILQKVSSDKAHAIRGYNVGIFVQLFGQLPYVLGILLDLIAGICTLVAVNRLPLFIVQAVIACCVVLTAFLERIFLHRALRPQTYYATGVVLLGLICVAFAAHSEKAAVVGAMVRFVLAITPVILLLVGAVVVRMKRKIGAFVLAALSGCAFGGDSIIGRILIYPHPLWLLIRSPLLWSLIAYGALGIFFFTAALQRTLATIVNGLMTSTQTLIPLIIGITLLGDTARNGLWLPVWVGCVLVTGGCVYIAYTD